MTHAVKQPPFIDTLRLSDAEAATLCARLDRAGRGFHGRDLRQHTRLALTPAKPMVARVAHSGASEVDYAVRTRNISRGGAAFLHGGYVHPTARCELIVSDARDGARRIAGSVVACRHVERHAHEVAMRFDAPMDQRDALLPSRDTTSHNDNTSTSSHYRGRALCVDACEASRMYAAFLLSRLGLHVDLAASGDEARQQINKARGYDLIVVDAQLTQPAGLSLVQTLRQTRRREPIVLTTDDDRESMRRRALDAGCDFVLDKPLAFEDVSAALDLLLPQATAQLKRSA